MTFTPTEFWRTTPYGLGRFWGASAIGFYGRAYQLVSVPTDNLNTAAGEVAFSALSRVQNDPIRLRSYFLKGYTLVLAMTLPITIACTLFADDVIEVVLGPKVERGCPDFSLAGADDSGFRDRQSVVMAAHREGAGGATA